MVYMKKPPKAILFDFDGVLAKTMKDNYMAWKKAFAEFGMDLPSEEYYPLEGEKTNKIAKEFCKKNGIDEKHHDDIVQKKEKYYIKDNTFEFYPGVLDLINKLKSKKIPIAIVTSGHSARLNATVPKEFLEKFDSIITSDKIKNAKPAPDPFLKVTEELDLNPEECIVIENAPLGIKSAKSAGMYCIAICSTLDKSYLNEADIIIDNFKDLEKTKIFKTYSL